MRVAVGCSYTAGTGVEPNQAYPALLGYTNLAAPGSDIEYSMWMAHRAVLEGAKDILFQLTSWDRITLSREGRTNFNQNRAWTGEPISESYTIADYMTSTQPQIKWLFENHVMSNWRTENLAQRLHELKHWAGAKGCRIFYFDWLPRHDIRPHPLMQELLPDASVLDSIGPNYYLDNAYHINSEGHRRVAEGYLA